VQEDGIYRGRCFGQRPNFDLYPCCLKPLGTTGRNGIGISHCGDDTSYAGRNDGLDARRLLALMCAGLEGHDQSRPTSPLTRLCQCHRLGVPVAVLGMPPFTYRLVSCENYGPDERILLDSSPTPHCEIEGAGHGLTLVHPALEAHSQAEAGEELPLRGVKLLEFGGEVLILASLVSYFTGKPHHR
jgi:hypothetical protein